MGTLLALEGNEAAAEAMRQINPDVVAAYPITPQTEVVQKFAQFVADGDVDTEYVAVESEHSAMSACVGAAAGGARVMTATCSQGMALMWEIMYIASSLRLPIVMSLVNRALSGNINIHCDHSDAMGARDSGWIQLFSENAQEAYDNLIQAIRIAEALELPALVNYDGFFISHSVEGVEIEDDDKVREFVGERPEPKYSLLDLDNPITVGPLDLQDFYFEHKRSQIEAYGPAKDTVLRVAAEFGEVFGRSYSLLELHGMDDAEVAVLGCGSTAGTAIDIAEQARQQGIKAGLIKLRSFRPFPDKELAEATSGLKALAVLDRCGLYGAHLTPLCADVTSALYMQGVSVPVVDYVYGLGGREVRPEHLLSVYTDLSDVAEAGGTDEPIRFLGVRDRQVVES
ncbi:MAG: pyruvate ferredoxin oxidoreductase [Armatimonadota bacterium]|jgi:pyruvate ferredoxin oxidoreductase alpha subunit